MFLGEFLFVILGEFCIVYFIFILSITQEKAFPTPARTKSYQPPSPPVPKVVPLVRSASEDQVVLKQQQEEEDQVGEVVKDEVPWTEAMVQDMFDCLDQVRQTYSVGRSIL